MRAALIWGRRSTVLRAVPVVLGILTFAVASNDAWMFDWLFASRAPMGLFPLVSVVLAGCVAHDISRSWAPVASDLGTSLQRWRVGYLLIPLAGVALVVLCHLMIWSVMAVICVKQGALGWPDPWVIPELLCAAFASASLGMLIGARVRSVAAGPLAAAASFAAYLLSQPYGLNHVFGVVGASDSLLGLTRAVPRAILTLSGHLAVAAALSMLCIGPVKVAARRVAATLALATFTALAIMARSVIGPAEYVPTTEQVCLTESNVICGPAGSEPLLPLVAEDLRWAEQRLGRSGLDLPRQFVLDRGSRPTPPGQTVVPYGAAQIRRLDRATLVTGVLSRPRLCPQLFTYTPQTDDLLKAEDTIRGWLSAALRTESGPAPEQVRVSYAAITDCRPP